MAGHGIRPLPTGGGRRLSNTVVNEVEENVKNDIKKAARLAGIDPNAAGDDLANSHERQALVSLRYNNVPSPKAIAALLRGNRAEAYLEIAYRSNGSKEAGFVKRRMAEAAEVLGDPKTWTPDRNASGTRCTPATGRRSRNMKRCSATASRPKGSSATM